MKRWLIFANLQQQGTPALEARFSLLPKHQHGELADAAARGAAYVEWLR